MAWAIGNVEAGIEWGRQAVEERRRELACAEQKLSVFEEILKELSTKAIQQFYNSVVNQNIKSNLG